MVVIGADVGVDVLPEGGEEGGVRGEWADDVDAFRAGFFEAGNEEFDFLTAEEAAFSGVGVEAGHGEAGLAATDRFHGLMSEANDLENALFTEEVGDIVEGDVGGDEGAGDLARSEHHGVVRRLSFLNKVFGVTGVVFSGEVPSFLVDGIGNDAGEVTRHGGLEAGFKTGEAMSAGFGRDLAWSDL